MRLVETIFGIAVAYLVNRFFDPRNIRKLTKEDETPIPEIREAGPGDLPQIMSIWLGSSLSSHPFIDALYWHKIYDSVRSRYRDTAKVFVYEATGQISGFISVSDDTEIDGLHVNEKDENHEIEDRLLHHCQQSFASLSAKAYSKNQSYVDVLLKAGFCIVSETVDEATGAEQYNMAWSHKS